MRASCINSCLDLGKSFVRFWKNWRTRREQIFELSHADPTELQRIASDLKVPKSELRLLSGYDANAADLSVHRLRSVDVEPATIEPAVMRDLQRCCSQCDAKALCEHELQDRPKAASWPKYCPNEQTINALVTERSCGCG